MNKPIWARGLELRGIELRGLELQRLASPPQEIPDYGDGVALERHITMTIPTLLGRYNCRQCQAMKYQGMRTLSGHNGRVFVASSSDIAGVTFPPVLLRLGERASAFHLSIRHSCQIPVYRRPAGAVPRADAMRWRHPRQSTQQSIKEGGRARAIGAEQMPSDPHLLIGPSAATGEWVSNRLTSRRPKSILGFCPAESICFGHLTLSDFPLPPSPDATPSCLPQSSPAVRRSSGIPGQRRAAT